MLAGDRNRWRGRSRRITGCARSWNASSAEETCGMTLSVIPFSEHLRHGSARRGTWVPSPELVTSVAQIIADVRLRGDAALIDYTRRYDDAHYDLSKLRVAIPMQSGARALVP